MSRKNKPQDSATIKQYKKYRNAHYALKVAPFPTVLTPFAVELGFNWGEWFGEGKDNTSIGLGLAMAIVTTVLSVLAIVKKDSELMKKIGAFVSVGIMFLAWGAICILLASVLTELGTLLLYSGAGIIGAAVEESVDKAVVKEKYEFMLDLVNKNGLSKKGEWQHDMSVQAEADKNEKYKGKVDLI